MKTYTKEMTEIGYKVNSMYQPDTVVCEASNEEMLQFYLKTDGTRIKAKEETIYKMSTYEINSDNSVSSRPLLIEI